MRILVTGNEGYIGSVLTTVLLDAGHEVVGLDTGFFASAYFVGKKASIPVIKKDIRNVTVGDVTGFDAIIHLAELSNDPLGAINPELTADVNHNGTKKIADAAVEAHIPRFVYASSCIVYGASDEIRDETSETNPITSYAKNKVLNEQYLLHISDDRFTPVILRNATVFGVSPRLRFDLAVNNLAGSAWTTGVIKMDSDGTPWRPFVHVQDACQAMLLAATAPAKDVAKQILNVGNINANYQIRDIAQIISRVFNVKEMTLNSHGADKRNYRVNFDKIKKVLPGFSPSWDVEKGAQELLAAFKAVNLTGDIFLSKEFTRLKMIDDLKKTGKLSEDLYWL